MYFFPPLQWPTNPTGSSCTLLCCTASLVRDRAALVRDWAALVRDWAALAQILQNRLKGQCVKMASAAAGAAAAVNVAAVAEEEAEAEVEQRVTLVLDAKASKLLMSEDEYKAGFKDPRSRVPGVLPKPCRTPSHLFNKDMAPHSVRFAITVILPNLEGGQIRNHDFVKGQNETNNERLIRNIVKAIPELGSKRNRKKLKDFCHNNCTVEGWNDVAKKQATWCLLRMIRDGTLVRPPDIVEDGGDNGGDGEAVPPVPAAAAAAADATDRSDTGGGDEGAAVAPAGAADNRDQSPSPSPGQDASSAPLVPTPAAAEEAEGLEDDDGGNFLMDPDDDNSPMPALPGAATLEEGGAGGSSDAERRALEAERGELEVRRELEATRRELEAERRRRVEAEQGAGIGTTTAMTSASSSAASNNRTIAPSLHDALEIVQETAPSGGGLTINITDNRVYDNSRAHNYNNNINITAPSAAAARSEIAGAGMLDQVGNLQIREE